MAILTFYNPKDKLTWRCTYDRQDLEILSFEKKIAGNFVPVHLSEAAIGEGVFRAYVDLGLSNERSQVSAFLTWANGKLGYFYNDSLKHYSANCLSLTINAYTVHQKLYDYLLDIDWEKHVSKFDESDKENEHVFFSLEQGIFLRFTKSDSGEIKVEQKQTGSQFSPLPNNDLPAIQKTVFVSYNPKTHKLTPKLLSWNSEILELYSMKDNEISKEIFGKTSSNAEPSDFDGKFRDELFKAFNKIPDEITEAPTPIETPKILFGCVKKAQSNYQLWCKNHHKFYQFFNGRIGQNRALDLVFSIKDYTSEKDIALRINELLADPFTRYRRHSFATYLLAELKQIDYLKLSTTPIDTKDRHRFPKKKVCKLIEQKNSEIDLSLSSVDASPSLLECIRNAQYRYEAWYKKSHQLYDFFHSKIGQKRADNFLNSIIKYSSKEDIHLRLHEFLKDKSTNYHSHSFATYLLIELKQINYLMLRENPVDKVNHFTKEEIAKRIDLEEAKIKPKSC